MVIDPSFAIRVLKEKALWSESLPSNCQSKWGMVDSKQFLWKSILIIYLLLSFAFSVVSPFLWKGSIIIPFLRLRHQHSKNLQSYDTHILWPYCINHTHFVVSVILQNRQHCSDLIQTSKGETGQKRGTWAERNELTTGLQKNYSDSFNAPALWHPSKGMIVSMNSCADDLIICIWTI